MFGGLIAGTIGGLYNIASGLIQQGKANSLAAQSVRPVYTPPDEIAQNQRLAQQLAQVGMSRGQYDNDLNNIDTNESAGLSALNQSRNSLAGVGNLVAQGNAAALNLDAEDDAIKRQNLQGLMNANNTSAEYADKAFQYNDADKYAQDQARISQLRGVGQQNLNSGVNSLTSTAQAYYLGKDKK